MPKKPDTKEITGDANIADASVEAIVLVQDRVDLYLKSGSVLKLECIDPDHAALRYKAACDILGVGYASADSTEVPDCIDDYLKESESSEEEED